MSRGEDLCRRITIEWLRELEGKLGRRVAADEAALEEWVAFAGPRLDAALARARECPHHGKLTDETTPCCLVAVERRKDK